MKKISLMALVAFVSMIFVTSCNSQGTMSKSSLKTDVDSASYIMGKGNASGMKEQIEKYWPVKGNVDAYIAGFLDGMKNSGDSLFLGKNMDEANAYIQAFFQNAQARQNEETLNEGKKFLEGNKSKSGVITTESGLQYKVLTEGKGERPVAEDTVKVNYIGRLLDGTVFDQSQEPITFPLKAVIKGWSEGVQLMPVGSKYQMWIPSDLAYGPQGSQMIKPNSTLEFEVELLEVIKAKE